MGGRILTAGLVLGVMAALGCTGVQKGTAAGGALGSGAGALVGHAMTGIGSGPGALVGLGLGAAGGAVAAEYYYGPEQTGEMAAANQRIEDLDNQLRAKDAQLADAQAALEREKAQQTALLQAMDSDRKDRQPVTATISPDVKVTKQGDTVTFTILSAVLFDSGKAQLRADGKAALKQAAREIRSKYAGCPVEVRGHTDNEPIKYSHYASNAELAEARALAVVHYLTQSEGFDSSLMTTIGYADTRPVADNSTAQGRQKNRRAEIIVRTKKVDLASAEPSGS